MSAIPGWRDHFPIRWADERLFNRRELGRHLAAASVGVFLATAWTAIRTLGRRAPYPPPIVAIAERDEIPIGGYRLFRYPAPDDPAVLVRLAADRFVAYSQRCTHLGCPVIVEPAKRRFRCPCHEGFFALEDGRVLGGPPPRPLPRIRLSAKHGRVSAIGLEEA